MSKEDIIIMPSQARFHLKPPLHGCSRCLADVQLNPDIKAINSAAVCNNHARRRLHRQGSEKAYTSRDDAAPSLPAIAISCIDGVHSHGSKTDVPCIDVRTPRRLRPVVSHFRPAVTRPCTLPSTPESALSCITMQLCQQYPADTNMTWNVQQLTLDFEPAVAAAGIRELSLRSEP